MMSDFLVQSERGDQFVLVSDGTVPGLADAVRSPRLLNLLAEHGLAEGFLAQYAGQLALGAVDSGLLTHEGDTVKNELDTLYMGIQVIDPRTDTDITMTGDSEAERLFSALAGLYIGGILDYQGYTSANIDPFAIDAPIQDDTDRRIRAKEWGPYSPGDTVAWTGRIAEPWQGVVDVVRRIQQQEGRALGVTHYRDQHTITYDDAGIPVHVVETADMAVGVMRRSEFVRVDTIVRPFGSEDL